MTFESRGDAFLKFNFLTPFICQKMIRKIHQTPLSKGIIDNTIPEIIEIYSKHYKKNWKGSRIPQKIDEKYLDKDIKRLANQNTLFLQDAKELYELAQRATSAKSSLYYYSWKSYFAFLVYSFLRYNTTSQHHGISIKNWHPDKVSISLRSRKSPSFLNRVLDLFTILGYPVVYADMIPKRHDKLIFERNRIERPDKISFKEIYEFDIQNYIENNYVKKGFYEYVQENPEWVSQGILSYLTLFIASSYERYQPHVWSDIICGHTESCSNIRVRTLKAYEDYEFFVINVNSLIIRDLFPASPL